MSSVNHATQLSSNLDSGLKIEVIHVTKKDGINSPGMKRINFSYVRLKTSNIIPNTRKI